MKFDATRVVQLEKAFSGLSQSYIRVHNGFIDASKTDNCRLQRRQAVLVKNCSNRHSIIRYVLGDPTGRMKQHEVALDYDATEMLLFSEGDCLLIRPARSYEIVSWYWTHPDLMIRMSSRSSVVGLVLGIVGLFISLVPLI